MVEIKYCEACEHINHPDESHCRRCGHPFQAEDTMLATIVSSHDEGHLAEQFGTLRVGQLVAERYRLLAPLGKGGMSTVWRALQLGLERDVALKFTRSEALLTPKARIRFMREAVHMGQLSHPNLLNIYDAFEWQGGVMLVLELVKGGSVRDLLARNGRLSESVAERLIIGVLQGLGYMHSKQLIHRDVKPGNVLVESSRYESIQARLADLGVAVNVHGPRDSSPGGRTGTLSYMAPEVLLGHAPSEYSDIYAVGLLLYEMLVGEPVFNGTRYEIQHAHLERLPDFSRVRSSTMVTALERALHKSPDRRFSSCAEFLHVFK